AWAKQTFKQPGDLLGTSSEVQLSAIADAKIVAAARRMLSDLGKKDAAAITVADTIAITKAFSETVLNGDGIVIPESTDGSELRRAIGDAIASVGSATDRSGKPGIDQALADRLFAEVDAYNAWLTGREAATALLGPDTATAATAFTAVRAKLEDHFARCKVA